MSTEPILGSFVKTSDRFPRYTYGQIVKCELALAFSRSATCQTFSSAHFRVKETTVGPSAGQKISHLIRRNGAKSLEYGGNVLLAGL